MGWQCLQWYTTPICCLAIWNFLSSYLKDKPCKTIENIFAWKVFSNKQQKIWTSNARSRKVLSYVFFFCKRYFLNSLIDAEPHVQCQGKSYHNVVFLLPKIFKQPKEETSSSPMPDLTSKRVGVGELLAIAPSRRTSKFKIVSIANIVYKITLDGCFLFWFN